MKEPEADELAEATVEPKRRKATLEELTAITKRASVGVKRPYPDHGDLLYDEYGLPK